MIRKRFFGGLAATLTLAACCALTPASLAFAQTSEHRTVSMDSLVDEVTVDVLDPLDADEVASALRGRDIYNAVWLGGTGSIPTYVRTQIRDAIGEAR